jgi:methionyl-tRNA formyltransferase
MRLAPTAVKACAQQHGLPVLEMSKQNYAEVSATLDALERPDFLVVVAFGIILKDDLLDWPVRGAVNLHASLLPKYRGVSPIQAAILAGDAETGCTTMHIDAGIDTGDILLTKTTPISGDDTAGSLEARLAAIGAPLMVETLRGIVGGSVQPTKQDDARANYVRMIRKRHGRINWTKSAVHIERQVRAMQPWPTAHTTFRGKRLIVLEAVPGEVAAAAGDPGTVAETSPLCVHTGEGALEIVRLKIAGKKEAPAKAFAAGYQVRKGERLAEDAES